MMLLKRIQCLTTLHVLFEEGRRAHARSGKTRQTTVCTGTIREARTVQLTGRLELAKD